jgi:general secretion pathway protein A
MKALLDFFSLAEDPFGDTPDTSFLYSSATHREAFATLLWGINANRGFIGLTARPGMGKTTLLFKLMSELNQTTTTAFVFQTQVDADNMLRQLVADLGLPPDGSPAQIHAELNRFLKHQAKLGKRVLLIIDEAQNLQDSVLEMLRLISDFETEQRKLVQFILSGQTQLIDRLAAPSLEQLRQRIASIARIEPFDEEEVAHYIQHRLTVAGGTGAVLFSDDAVRLIAQASQGIPREINSVAFSALCIAYATKRREIDVGVVCEAINDRSLSLISKQTETNPFRTSTRMETAVSRFSTRSLGDERRSSGRRSADFQHVRSGKQDIGLVVNVGPGGAALWVSAPDGSRDLQINFRLPGSDLPLETEAKIVWKRESERLVGVVFSAMSPDTRAQLESWTVPDHVEEPPKNLTRVGQSDTPTAPQKPEEDNNEDSVNTSHSKPDGAIEARKVPDGSTDAMSAMAFQSLSPLSILNPDRKAKKRRFRGLWISRPRTSPG